MRRLIPWMLLMLASGASAQDASGVSRAAADDLAFEDEFVIKGEVQTPEVVVVIARGNLNKGYEFELKESFLKNIVEALDAPPF